MAGGNPVRAQARKKKRHEVSVELPASVLALVRELEAAASAATPADAVQAAVLRDVARLAAAERVDEQSRVVSGWGASVFGTDSLARGAAQGDAFWGVFLRLCVRVLFCFRLAHIQKSLVGALAAAAPAELVARLNETLIPAEGAAWMLRRTGGDGSAADAKRQQEAFLCDVDCLLDHPKPLLADGVSRCFPQMLSTLVAVCGDFVRAHKHYAAKTGVASADGDAAADDAASPEASPQAAAGEEATVTTAEDLKYATRITLSAMQKFRGELRREVASASGGAAAAAVPTALAAFSRLSSEMLHQPAEYPKELLLTAGIAVAVVFQACAEVAHGPAAFREHAVMLLDAVSAEVDAAEPAATTPEGSSEDLLSGLLSGAAAGGEQFARVFARLPDFSKLVVFKGFLNCGDERVYLLEVPRAVRPPSTTEEGAEEGDGVCFLFHAVLARVSGLVTSPDPPVRYLALQTTELVIRKVRDHLARYTDLPADAAGAAAGAAGGKKKNKGMAKKAAAAAAAAAATGDGAGGRCLLRSKKTLSRVLGGVLDLLWLCWDEPTAAVGHILTEIFTLSLEVHARGLPAEAAADGSGSPSAKRRRVEGEGGEEGEPEGEGAPLIDMRAITQSLLTTHWLRRGKYPSLSVALPVVGVDAVREMCPNIVECVLSVIHVKSLAHGAGAFLALYAAELQKACPALFEDDVLLPCARALLLTEREGAKGETKQSLLLHHLCNYGLQPLFPTAFKLILDAFGRVAAEAVAAEGVSPAAKGATVRRLTGFIVYMCKLAKYRPAPADDPLCSEVLRTALTADSPAIRMGAAQILCVGFRRSDLPTAGELQHLKSFTIRNFKTSDASFRTQHGDLLKRMLARIKDSLHRYEKDAAKKPGTGTDKTKKKETPEAAAAAAATAATLAQNRAATVDFLGWFCAFLVQCSYPTSPLDRRCLALELLRHTAEFFGDSQTAAAHPRAREAYATVVAAALPPSLVESLLNTIGESWDRIRTATWDLVTLYPSPLPSLRTQGEIEALAATCTAGIASAKIKDADSAALLYRLLHEKYHVQLGYRILIDPASGRVGVSLPDGAAATATATATATAAPLDVHYDALQQMVLRMDVMKAQRDAQGGFQPIHGLLGVMRNVFAGIPLVSLGATAAAAAAAGDAGYAARQTRWAELVRRTIQAVIALCTDAMRNVAGATTGDIEGYSAGGQQAAAAAAAASGPAGVDCRGHAFFADRNDDSADRLVVVNSWLAVKEGSALITRLVLSAPMPSPLLPARLVNECGLFLLNMGLQGKHNGVIAKAAEALGLITHRVIRLPGGGAEGEGGESAALSALPGRWLATQLVQDQVLSADESRILRRSAGLPPMLLSVLDAEDLTRGKPRLTHYTIGTLLEILEEGEGEGGRSVHHRINALNVLKYVVDDATLRDSVLAYASRMLVTALDGFNHESWNVRNSSLMLYSSLLQRVVGVGSSATSFKDFLARYSEVTPHLAATLRRAVAGSGGAADGLHPALYPLLLLFSLLAPSSDLQISAWQRSFFDAGAVAPDAAATSALGTGEAAGCILELVAFCGSSRQYMAREMSARALVPLIMTDVLPSAAAYFLQKARSCMVPGMVRNNALHGALCQALHMLTEALPSLEAADAAALAERCAASLVSLGVVPCLAAHLLDGGGVGNGRVAAVNAALALNVCREAVRRAPAGSAAAAALAAEARSLCARLFAAGGTALSRIAAREIGGEALLSTAGSLYLETCAAAAAAGGDGEDRREEALRFVSATVLATVEGSVVTKPSGHDCALLPAALGSARALGLRPAAGAVGAKLLSLVARVDARPALAYDIQFTEGFAAVLEAFSEGLRVDAAGDAAEAVAAALWKARATLEASGGGGRGVLETMIQVQARLVGGRLARGEWGPSLAADVARLASELLAICSGEQAVELRAGCAAAVQHLSVHGLHAAATAPGTPAEKRSALLVFVVQLYRVVGCLLCDENEAVRTAASSVVREPPQAAEEEPAASSASGGVTGQLLRAVRESTGLHHCEKNLEIVFEWLGYLGRVAAAETGCEVALQECLETLSSVCLHPKTPGTCSIHYEGVAVRRPAEEPATLAYQQHVAEGNDNVIFELEGGNYFVDEMVVLQLALRTLASLRDAVPAVSAFVAQQLAPRLAVEARCVSEVCAGPAPARALSFTSVYRVAAASRLLDAAARQAGALPTSSVDSLWIQEDGQEQQQQQARARLEGMLWLIPAQKQ